jgi:cold shock CspA family protein
MSSTSDVTTSPETTCASRLIGRVKWFNNKAGYGFVTITDGEKSGTDVFVHHSSINVLNQQYKYLVQGEYIELNIVNVENSTHECQSSNVSGIKGGKLMCETRHELKIARNNYKSTGGPSVDNECFEPIKLPRQQKVRPESDNLLEQSPCQSQSQDLDGKSWTMISKRSKPTDKQSLSTTNPGRGRGRPPRSKI